MAITSKLQQQGGFVEAIVDTDPRSWSIENLPINSIVYFSWQSFQKIGTWQNDYTTLNWIKTVTSNYTLQNSDNTLSVNNNITITIPTTIQKNKVYKIINNTWIWWWTVTILSSLTYFKQSSLAINRKLHISWAFFEFYCTSAWEVVCINDKFISEFINWWSITIDNNMPTNYVSVNYITDWGLPWIVAWYPMTSFFQDFWWIAYIEMSNVLNYRFVLEDIE